MVSSYTHLPEEEDIGPEDRCYRAQEEIIDYKGRQVLCLHVEAWGVTSCCGGYASHIATTYIAGYIVHWKHRTNENGEALSEVERISDQAELSEIKHILQEAYGRAEVYPLFRT